MTTPSNEYVPQSEALRFRQRLAKGEALLGCFLSLGSAQTAEVMAAAGYDWGLIDLEHGAGDEQDALVQMQALATRRCLTIVRVESTARQRVHRVLDFGAHGIMFPRIETVEEAKAAVAAMRYPPAGVRGVAFSNRACGYGSNFHPYMEGSRALLTIVQIESPTAVANSEAIADIDGVDVLFIGPTDLSHSMGILGNFEHPDFVSAVLRAAQAASSHGKHCGILLPNPRDIRKYFDLGFRFIASGSDAVLLNNAARSLFESLHKELTAPKPN
ncbi:MAG: aldolase/citrate lyase family protein [Terriglobia bacterium]